MGLFLLKRTVKVRLASLACLLAAILPPGLAQAAEEESIIYLFDRSNINTSPSVCQFFDQAVLHTERNKPDYLVKLVEKSGNGDFPETQLYPAFKDKLDATMSFSFSYSGDSDDYAFNIAFVGNNRFQFKPGGFVIWLTLKRGHIAHYSDGGPVNLFKFTQNIWYHVTLKYFPAKGEYQLTIKNAAGEALYDDLTPNATGKSGYDVKLLSFSGNILSDETEGILLVKNIVVSQKGYHEGIEVEYENYLSCWKRTAAMEKPDQ